MTKSKIEITHTVCFYKYFIFVLFVCFQVLQANRDTNTIVDRPLVPAIIASKIRLVPYSGHPRMVCLRAEIVGCYNYGMLIYIIYCYIVVYTFRDSLHVIINVYRSQFFWYAYIHENVSSTSGKLHHILLGMRTNKI